MYAAMDATGTQTGKSLNTSSFIAIFYIVAVLLGWFLLLSVGLAVLVHSFNEAAFAVDALKPPASKPTRTRLPYVFDAPLVSNIRKVSYAVGQARGTERVVSLMIIINVSLLGLESYKIGNFVNDLGEALNFFFTFFFACEAVIQLVGTHPRQFFTDSFNIFDISLVFGAFIAITLEATVASGAFEGLPKMNVQSLRMVRVLRIFRTLRAVRMLKSLRELSVISVMIFKSYSIICNLLSLLLLLFFTYGVLGVALFSHMCSSHIGPGMRLTDAKTSS